MYEVDFTGWVREPKELEKIKSDWKYRLFLNWKRVYYAFKIKQFWRVPDLLVSAIFNKGYF